MKFTIQSYRKTSLPKSGKTVYPFAGFYKNQLKFGFDRQGPMVIRCQILEAGTSTEAKIKVKIPVWDIDDAQFVGIKQNNGTMDHRYYYTGADDWLRAKNGVTVAGVSGFTYVEGKFGTSAKDLDTPQACAVWEMTTSDFSFAYGYYNNGTTAESTRGIISMCFLRILPSVTEVMEEMGLMEWFPFSVRIIVASGTSESC